MSQRSPRSSVVLRLIFRFVICFDLDFVYGMRYGSKLLLSLFAFGGLIVPAPRGEKPLYPLNCVGTFAEK